MLAPSFVGQFDEEIGIDKIYSVFFKLGFDYVFEIATAASLVNLAMEQYLKETKIKPVISSACPSAVRLIALKFPEFTENISLVDAPMDVGANVVKKLLSREKKIAENKIGAFFITPCPAKVTAAKDPIGKKQSPVDGVFSMKEIYDKIMKILDEVKDYKRFDHAVKSGIIWGVHEGEIDYFKNLNTLAIAGVHNIISFFENIDERELKKYDFIEVQACIPGCVGGVLTPEDKFVAERRLKRFAYKYDKKDMKCKDIFKEFGYEFFLLEQKVKPKEINKLDDDVFKAMQKAEMIEEFVKEFPGLDCGICGCPTCRALAEDIVRGKATKYDCIFVLKDKMKEMVEKKG
jgi:iron only hydrogenase large subunit-like protein